MKDDSDVLIGTRIVLDEEKIRREKKYNYDALLNRLDFIFEHFGSVVLEHGHLYGNAPGMLYHDSDISQTSAMYYLGKCKWFIDTVKTWEMSYGYADGEDRVWSNTLEAYYKSGFYKVVKYVE